MAEPAVVIADYARLIRDNRNFRLLWTAQIVSELGDWFYSVAIFSFLLQVAGTAQSVAFAFVLQVLPQFFAAPSSGVINDRVRRKYVMIFADWMRAIRPLPWMGRSGRLDEQPDRSPAPTPENPQRSDQA